MTDTAQKLRNIAFLLDDRDGSWIPKEIRRAADELECLRTALVKRESCECHHCLRVRGTPLVNTRMVLCPICGNKRCPHASDHTLDCTNSNEPGQAGSIYPATRLLHCMDGKISLRDWAPLFTKATTQRQIEAIYSALDACFVEDRTIMSNNDWPLLRNIASAALVRVGRNQENKA